MRRWDLSIVFYKFTAEIWACVLVGHENINPRKHMNHSDLNHLGTPILTVNFLNVLSSLYSEFGIKTQIKRLEEFR